MRAGSVAAALALAAAVVGLFVLARRLRTLARERDAVAAGAAELTRRLQAHVDALSASRAELLAVMEHMAEGVLVLAPGGRVVLANRACARLLGTPGPIAAGSSVEETARVPGLLETLERAARGPAAAEVELAGPPPRIVRVRAVPLDETPGGVLAVLDDVTEFRRLDEVRRDFVAPPSPALQTPRTAHSGDAEMLLDDTKAEEAGIILHHARRMAKLVDDLLALSRLEARAAEIPIRALDVDAVVTRALPLIRPLAEGKQVALTADIAPGVRALGDEEALLRILLNLLDNAVKYSPPGGRVTVAAGPEGAAWTRVSVRDAGPGIPAEHLPRLFERFYRVDKARSRELGGTGLGLAIVKHLAERLGGTAYIESEAGQGTEAGVRLKRPPEP